MIKNSAIFLIKELAIKMHTKERQKFSSQVNPALLEKLHYIASTEGRHFQAVLEDAFQIYIDARLKKEPQETVETHLQASIKKNQELGKLLAQ